MMLVFDHALTLPREIALVWRARMSVVKAAFLFNRYIVPGALLVMLYGELAYAVLCVRSTDHAAAAAMVGFEGMVLTDGQCQSIITMAIVVAVCTMALANFTVLMRVSALWEHKRVRARARVRVRAPRSRARARPGGRARTRGHVWPKLQRGPCCAHPHDRPHPRCAGAWRGRPHPADPAQRACSGTR
jgi:hypothetical protein